MKTNSEECGTAKATAGSFVSTRNACKLCAPLGASIVFRGIQRCVPLVHGSQGCSTYIRRYVISHYREPVDIASSNFSETSAIFGGGTNLLTALDNVIRQYQPEAVGIATTCLSETIGDDVALYLEGYRSSNRSRSLPAIIHASTPSYRGTHMDGFREAVRATAAAVAEGGGRGGEINLLPGFMSPEDLRLFREILGDFGVGFTMLPDYSDTLDGGAWEEYQRLSPGGTPVAAIRKMGRAAATIQLGGSLSGEPTAASHLEEAFGVPAMTLGMPVGVRASDRFFSALEKVTGRAVPDKYRNERERAIDTYIDGHKYLFGKRAVIVGDEDLTIGLVSFADEIGMNPVLCATGARSARFEGDVRRAMENGAGTPAVLDVADYSTLYEAARDMNPDIVIGNSKALFLSKRLGVPLVRTGFPVHDRIGGQRILHAGYRGAMQLYDRVANALIAAQQESSPAGYWYF